MEKKLLKIFLIFTFLALQILSSSILAQSKTTKPVLEDDDLFENAVQFTLAKAQKARNLAFNFTLTSNKKLVRTQIISGMNDCLELLDDTIELLANIEKGKDESTDIEYSRADIHSWLSAAITNQETCLESLENYELRAEKGLMAATAGNLSYDINESLSLFLKKVNSADGDLTSHQNPISGRRLLSNEKFPTWVSAGDRKLLEASVDEIKPHAVVAKDGSGTHKTISEAIAFAASLAGGGRSVIHLTAGTYNEYINVPTKQKNVMLIGDGKGKTVIVGSRNYVDGWTTYDSATVGAMGDGFIARDITIVNSAGPSKHQAVALRVGSDRSVVFRCSILGYQDTLYTHSKRQFYRENDIYGTVDFIFGNSAVVIQSCNIFARKPSSSEVKNFVTAQGRSSPDQNTGISIHNCRIQAASDLAPVKSNFETFLGRPWKQYSRVVIMESFIDDSISPLGWSPWNGGLKSLFYGEFKNAGPGASTARRVGWPGYHASLTPPQANSFTVAGFIAGDAWLPSTGVSFDSGLLG
ncbi:hypothetical protein UlMin_010574 [Ulmus minor]